MGEFEVRRLRADEWRELKELRIEALRDAPSAFSTPWREAAARPDRRWREDARRGTSDRVATFVAHAGRNLLGMVTGWEADTAAELIQMYVRAEARGNGVADALVDAVVAWARRRGQPRLELGVAEDNEVAIRFYRRCGFAPTGRVLQRREGNVAREVRMELFL